MAASIVQLKHSGNRTKSSGRPFNVLTLFIRTCGASRTGRATVHPLQKGSEENPQPAERKPGERGIISKKSWVTGNEIRRKRR